MKILDTENILLIEIHTYIQGISELLILTKIIVFPLHSNIICVCIQILYDTITSTLDSYRPQCNAGE